MPLSVFARKTIGGEQRALFELGAIARLGWWAATRKADRKQLAKDVSELLEKGVS
jgi:hypothetical protein